MKLQTLKGFRDMLPADALQRQFLVGKIRKTVESFGYDPLETPTLEYAEVLMGKYGEEADKLVYNFEDRGGRQVGLRFDQTVPTARVVGQYPLVLPFKRYQIQPAFRQEKPQKGRFREFLQFDVDIFGLKNELADAEILAVIYEIYTQLGFKNFQILINDRAILKQIMKDNEIPENSQAGVIRSLDKLAKLGQEQVKKEISKLGINADIIFNYLAKTQPNENLQKILNYLESFKVDKAKFKFEPTLARGLDYYTGLIVEVCIEGYSAGSVLGGGRYDKLIKQLGGPDIPAVGFAIGFDRTLEAAIQFGLITTQKTKSQVLVSVFSAELLSNSIEIANKLRGLRIDVEIFLDENQKLPKQFAYADKKGIPWVVILGPDEVKNNKLTLKNMQTGKQDLVNFEEAIKNIKHQ